MVAPTRTAWRNASEPKVRLALSVSRWARVDMDRGARDGLGPPAGLEARSVESAGSSPAATAVSWATLRSRPPRALRPSAAWVNGSRSWPPAVAAVARRLSRLVRNSFRSSDRSGIRRPLRKASAASPSTLAAATIAASRYTATGRPPSPRPEGAASRSAFARAIPAVTRRIRSASSASAWNAAAAAGSPSGWVSDTADRRSSMTFGSSRTPGSSARL